MKTRVSKWGNSLALRIPKSVVDDIGLADTAEVDVKVVAGSVVITPITVEPSIDELIASIDPATVHAEVDWGPPVGKEVW